MRSMRNVLTRVLLALMLVGAGGVVVADDHRGLAETPAGAVLSQFSLLALLEAHEPGGDIAMEHHAVCTDCTGLGAVLGLIPLLTFATRVLTSGQRIRLKPFPTSSLALSPLAPPPR